MSRFEGHGSEGTGPMTRLRGAGHLVRREGHALSYSHGIVTRILLLNEEVNRMSRSNVTKDNSNETRMI